MLLFQLEQGADGFNVPGVLLLCAALAQMVVRDVEVPGRHSVQGFIQGSGIREGLHLSVHHGRDGQCIQFLVGKLPVVLFLLVQLPDKSQRFLPENGHPHFCQCHILQGHAVLIEIDVIHPEGTSFHVDGSTQRQIILPAQILGLVMSAVLIQPSKINVLAALPQLLGTVRPLASGEASDRDCAQFRFLFQQFSTYKFADLPGILAVKFKLSVLLKTHQRIRVLLFQGVVLGGGIQRQQCRTFLRLAVVVLQFFIRDTDQFGKIQSLQLGFGQFFQTFVLPLVYQHITQIPLHPIPDQIYVDLNGDLLVGGIGVGDVDLGQVGKIRLGIILFLTKLPDQVLCTGQVGVRLCADRCRRRIMLLFLVRQVAVGLDHQVDILFHLRPFQGDFLVVGIMNKFQTLPVVIHKASTSVQKIVGVPTDAVLLCQCFGTEFAVRLGLVQRHNALFSACKP